VPSHEINIDGTFNVLRAAREGQAGRVVYAASSSAYGDTEVLPKVETMTPRPKSPYALQKLMGEYYCAVFSGVYGLETVALRYFNVYGPRQDPSSPYSGVLSVFMKAILERRSPTIFGDGEQSRDFTYVEDVADLNLKAARAGNVFRPALQRRQRRPDHLEPGMGAATEDGGSGNSGDLWRLARRRRARFASRHHGSRARPGPRAAVLI